MLLPKSQPVQKNLSTSYTNFDELLNNLRTSQFTGYLSLASPEYEGILLMDSGKSFNALEDANSQHRTGVLAFEGISAKAHEADGTISVYRLAHQLVELLGATFGSDALYSDSSKVTSLEKLVEQLSSRKHTGYIDITTTDIKDSITLFMYQGQTIETVLSDASRVSPGLGELNKTIQSSPKGAAFTVYGADLVKQHLKVGRVDSFAGQQALFLWEEILGAVEAIVDTQTKPATFGNAFRETSITQSKEFTFLDPFNSEFEYRERKIKFQGETTIADFNQALSQCLRSTISTLAAEKTAGTLSASVNAALEQVKAKRAGTIKDIAEFVAFDLDYKPSLYEQVLFEAKPFLANNAEGFIERQCREHLGVAPQALADEHLPKLAQQVETTASLMVSKEDAQALRKKIESLALQYAK